VPAREGGGQFSPYISYQSCDRGEGEDKDSQSEHKIGHSWTYTSQRYIHALNRVCETYRINYDYFVTLEDE
jgi:hypothetical protein